MELKFVSREGDYLVFETSDGIRAQTLIDDQVRDAIRKVQPSEEVSFTPREVLNPSHCQSSMRFATFLTPR